MWLELNTKDWPLKYKETATKVYRNQLDKNWYLIKKIIHYYQPNVVWYLFNIHEKPFDPIEIQLGELEIPAYWAQQKIEEYKSRIY